MAVFVVSSSGDDYEQVKNGRLETMRPKSEQYLISLGRRGALVSPKVFQKRETKNITPSDISVMYKSLLCSYENEKYVQLQSQV